MTNSCGLYRSEFEHDACGVGFIAHIKGQKSHSIVSQALDVLKNLRHRGAVGADPLQGDGAGILIQIPDQLYRDDMMNQGVKFPPAGEYGVGMVFLPQEAASRHACEEEIERAVAAEGQMILGWRDVPIDRSMPMSPVVREKEPVIRQVFIGHSPDVLVTDALERKLYIIRKRSSIAIANLHLKHCKEFYICSCSARTVVYKGQLLATQVGIYYRDLQDARCISALAMIHQRFSTNTFPQWQLAHPFRYIAHNGEINTLRGNFNWILAREKHISSPVLGDDLKKLWPLIFQGQSDSASFDNAFELLTMAGYSLAQAALMLIPEAWEKNKTMNPRLRALYEYNAALTKVIRQEDFTHNVYSINEDQEGNLWLGMRGIGLRIGANKWYKNDPRNPNSLSNDQVYSIYRDRKGRMWLGTFGGGLNLAVKTADGYQFKHFLQDNYGEKRIRIIEEDKNGRMWVGTNNGIYIFHPDSLINSPKNYVLYNHVNETFPSNEIRCLVNDHEGNMWIGTTGAGFAICYPGNDYQHLTFDCYSIKDGLPNGVIQSIVEDQDNKMWIATEYGISRFTLATKQIENYYFSSHTLGNVYSENTACINADGRLLFGTNYGLVVLDANKVENMEKLASTVFTGLHINGAHMLPGMDDSPLNETMSYTGQLNLKHYQNSFVIAFSTFNFLSGASKYSYRMPPYDSEWSIPSAQNLATYRNLPPGKYQLQVKACNVAGVWGEESTMEIVIAPPFWQTTWAYLIYLVFIGIVCYFSFHIIRKFNRLRNRIAVEKQLTEYKLEFFTNISHEFRTPLTLIQGALNKLINIENPPKEMQRPLKTMDKSTQRMLRLINQLLEFRKMQKNKLALSLEETDVIAFLYEIFLSFKDTSESKNIDFSFEPSQPAYKMFIDKGNLDKVTYNLLSNAFKYTPSNGKIIFKIDIQEDKQQLRIQVIDNGIGIPKEKRSELFKRFMQSSFSHSSVGVGLHLTHELVQVHKGNISYDENEGGGSVFTVLLPTNSDIYQEKDFLIPNQLLTEEEEQHSKDFLRNETSEDTFQPPVDPLNKRKVLIIEDDTDIREFLREEIGVYFEVEVAADGTSGFEKASTYDADLIVCDVLMPGMNGFEVTRKLKNEFTTSHIPIILLTALNIEEKYQEGIESGADAYITKPFNVSLLLARIFKLIELRDKLRQKYSNEPGLAHSIICTNDKDQKFSVKLNEVLNEHMTDTDFSVNDFAGIMGLGRTVFYKKVRGVTGYSPYEYLRVMRMKKAAEMLLTEDLTIAEVAYSVGINDPFYFSKCFKNQFGVSPSAYRKKLSEDENEPINDADV